MISLGKGNSIQKRIGSDNKKEDIIEDAIDSIWKINRILKVNEEKLEGYLGLDEIKFMSYTICHYFGGTSIHLHMFP